MNVDDDLFAIFGVFGSVLFVLIVFGCLLLVDAQRCGTRAEKMGFESSWGPIQGCMVKTPKGWILLDKYRSFD